LVRLVFGFEYAVLLTIIANTVVKYILHSIDLHSENPWDNKAVFMLYTELAIGFVKVIFYREYRTYNSNHLWTVF
jgi:E3 ubiquitin-protein ligase synoviolin